MRDKCEQARDILEAARKEMKDAFPLYQVILLKDLARTYALLHNRERCIRLFVKAMVLSEANGFFDQRRKILEVASTFGIHNSEIESET